MSKLTWKGIFDDFKKRHPKMHKKSCGFEPHSFATILIFFPDRIRMTYNYDTKELIKLNEQ